MIPTGRIRFTPRSKCLSKTSHAISSEFSVIFLAVISEDILLGLLWASRAPPGHLHGHPIVKLIDIGKTFEFANRYIKLHVKTEY